LVILSEEERMGTIVTRVVGGVSIRAGSDVILDSGEDVGSVSRGFLALTENLQVSDSVTVDTVQFLGGGSSPYRQSVPDSCNSIGNRSELSCSHNLGVFLDGIVIDLRD